MAGAGKRSFVALNLPDAEAARRVAEEIARRTGRTVVVTDGAGNQVATESAPQRNAITVRPNTSEEQGAGRRRQ